MGKKTDVNRENFNTLVSNYSPYKWLQVYLRDILFKDGVSFYICADVICMSEWSKKLVFNG